ncbi:MAG: hypothetical protein JXB38_09935 [Anaerolineales bacterium]|nr:hypothetical protein [Anaerolineales bacterium]
MLATVTHIIPMASIQRTRLLPIEGDVLVRAGQKVNATDIIAQANLNPEHVVLDVARGLGVQPGEAAEYIEREVGEKVSQGSIIASRPGLAARVVRAPRDGVLVVISSGQVMLQVSAKPFQLTAGVPGTIAKVEADYGAVVETTGSWLQAVWGNGHVNYGTLVVMAHDADHVLAITELDPSRRGSMVYAGHCNERKVLESAAEVQLRGLILGSMATSLIPVATRMPYPIIVLDGFGQSAVNMAAHKLLASNEGREITINAEPYDRFSGKRPEAIIPLPAAGEPRIPRNVTRFSAGQQVRVVRAPYTHKVGIIETLSPEPVAFPSGLRMAAARIEFSDGNKELVPLANIEVLG